MESFFNLNCFLNCFVSRAEAELEVFFSSWGEKKSHIHIHKFQVFPFYMLIRISSIWMLMKKVSDFSFASWPQQSSGFNTNNFSMKNNF